MLNDPQNPSALCPQGSVSSREDMLFAIPHQEDEAGTEADITSSHRYATSMKSATDHTTLSAELTISEALEGTNQNSPPRNQCDQQPHQEMAQESANNPVSSSAADSEQSAQSRSQYN